MLWHYYNAQEQTPLIQVCCFRFSNVILALRPPSPHTHITHIIIIWSEYNRHCSCISAFCGRKIIIMELSVKMPPPPLGSLERSAKLVRDGECMTATLHLCIRTDSIIQLVLYLFRRCVPYFQIFFAEFIVLVFRLLYVLTLLETSLLLALYRFGQYDIYRGSHTSGHFI